jgi:ATP-binding cassette, subfamily C, bacterial
MGWIEDKSVWLACPDFADVFEGREALERLQPPPIIVGIDEVVEVHCQLRVTVIMVALDGRFLDSSVHPFDLSVGPRIEAIQSAWNYCLHSLSALNETYALIDETMEFAEPLFDGERLALSDGLSLIDVSFSYSGETRASLVDINLTLPALTTTAIIGRSGAGKSSLADMMMGLISPSGGQMTVDGREIVGPARMAWRRSVGYVPQDAFLFHDNIRANLLAATPKATEADLVDALKQASAAFVFEMAEGLDSIVGDDGVRLSGGERQRIALARALLGKPQFLILDEATSALDPENETTIWEAISGLRGKLTLVVIGHRLAMLDQADQVIEVAEGRTRIIEKAIEYLKH